MNGTVAVEVVKVEPSPVPVRHQIPGRVILAPTREQELIQFLIDATEAGRRAVGTLRTPDGGCTTGLLALALQRYGIARVQRTLGAYIEGKGREQAAFDAVIDRLCAVIGYPHEVVPIIQTVNIHERQVQIRTWKVNRVQSANDSMTDQAALEWFRKALELTL